MVLGVLEQKGLLSIQYRRVMVCVYYVLARLSRGKMNYFVDLFVQARNTTLMPKKDQRAKFREEFARSGGFAKARKMTKEERSEMARRMVTARWAKRKKKAA